MSSRRLLWPVATIVIVVAISIALSPAMSSARSVSQNRTLRVTATTSQTAQVATYGFDFHGADVSGFQLSLPGGTSLRTRSFAKLGRYLSLDQTDGGHLGYELMETQAHSLSIDLRTVFAKFKVRFNAGALSFTPPEARLIAEHRVTSVTLTFTFMGSAEQFATARMKLHVA